MRSKGETSTNATYVVVFTIITIILAFAGLKVVGEWLGAEASEFSCMEKYQKFCTDWGPMYEEEPWEWDTVEPVGCAELEIYKPTEEDCKNFNSG